MSTETKTQNTIHEPMVSPETGFARTSQDKLKLMEELWEYCRLFPNDYDLGKNLRLLIIQKMME